VAEDAELPTRQHEMTPDRRGRLELQHGERRDERGDSQAELEGQEREPRVTEQRRRATLGADEARHVERMLARELARTYGRGGVGAVLEEQLDEVRVRLEGCHPKGRDAGVVCDGRGGATGEGGRRVRGATGEGQVRGGETRGTSVRRGAQAGAKAVQATQPMRCVRCDAPATQTGVPASSSAITVA
jgi:hypothetical protein